MEMEYLAMKLYCVLIRKKDGESNDVFPSPFRYVDAAIFLQTHPKFGSLSGDY